MRLLGAYCGRHFFMTQYWVMSVNQLVAFTGWASREVVWMFAGRFAHQIFELDPEIWYGHSLGYNKKLSLRSPRVFFFFHELRAKNGMWILVKCP